jgi:hypothetical protein
MPRKGKPSGTRRKRRGVTLRPTDLAPRDLALNDLPADRVQTPSSRKKKPVTPA